MSEKLNICLMSSYNQVCGIAEYTKYLVNEYCDKGHDVTVIGNYPYTDLTQEDEDFVSRQFTITIQDPDNKIGCNVEAIVALLKDRKIDILHIQFESALYHGNWFSELLYAVKNLVRIPVVITYHSSCIFPFNMGMVDHHIAHNEDIGSVLPPNCKDKFTRLLMGVEDLPYVEPPKKKRVVSFGLGRNMDDKVKEALKDLEKNGVKDVDYETSYGHQGWKTKDELIKFLQGSDIVVLYYPPTDATVSSSSASVALSAKRPVVCSNTKWFQSMSKYVLLANSVKQLSLILGTLLTNEEHWQNVVDNIVHCMNERSWSIISDRHLELYDRLVNGKN